MYKVTHRLPSYVFILAASFSSIWKDIMPVSASTTVLNFRLKEKVEHFNMGYVDLPCILQSIGSHSIVTSA